MSLSLRLAPHTKKNLNRLEYVIPTVLIIIMCLMLLFFFGLLLLPNALAGPSESDILLNNHCDPLRNDGICHLECDDYFQMNHMKSDCTEHPVEVELRNLSVCVEKTDLNKTEKYTLGTMSSIYLRVKVVTTGNNENPPNCLKFFVHQETSVTYETFEVQTKQLKQDIFKKFRENAEIRIYPVPPHEQKTTWWYFLAVPVLLLGVVGAAVGQTAERTRKRKQIEVAGTWIPDLENGAVGNAPKKGRYILSESSYGSSVTQTTLSQDSQTTPRGNQHYSIPHQNRNYRNPAPGYIYRDAQRPDAYQPGLYAPVRCQPEMLPPPLPNTPGYSNPRRMNGYQGYQGYQGFDQMSSADNYGSPIISGNIHVPTTANRLFMEATTGSISTPIHPLEVNSDVNGVFPIHAVVKREHFNDRNRVDQMIIDLGKILDAGADINKRTCINRVYNQYSSIRDEETALMIAVNRQLFNVARFLLSRGACQWRIDSKNSTCMHEAVRSENVVMVKLLLEYHRKDPHRNQLVDGLPKIDGVNISNMTPLMLCAQAQIGAEMAKLLIEMGGANVNSKGDENKFASGLQDHPELSGSTVLHYAVTYNNMELLDYLLTVDGLNINAKDVHERTAVYLCCLHGKSEALVKLLEKGANSVDPALEYGTKMSMDAMKENEVDNSTKKVREAAAGKVEILQILDDHDRQKMNRNMMTPDQRKRKRRSAEDKPTPRSPAPSQPPRASTAGIQTDGDNSSYHTPTTRRLKRKTMGRQPLSSVNLNIPRQADNTPNNYPTPQQPTDYTPNYALNTYGSNFQTPDGYSFPSNQYGQYYPHNNSYYP